MWLDLIDLRHIDGGPPAAGLASGGGHSDLGQ